MGGCFPPQPTNVRNVPSVSGAEPWLQKYFGEYLFANTLQIANFFYNYFVCRKEVLTL